MLCPKCGHISFDSLASCPSCNQDLVETQKTLNGTAIMVEEQYFLGSICDHDDKIHQPMPPEDEYDDPSGGESRPESDESTLPDETADDRDEIAFDLGGMPPLDQSSLDLDPDQEDSDDRQRAEGAAALTDNTPGNEAEISPEPEVGISLESELADLIKEENELPPESISNEEADIAPIILESPLSETKDEEKDYDQLTLDIDSLSLEIDDSPLEKPADQAEEAGDSGALSLDLEQIDLSDLVHAPQPAASTLGNSTIPQVDDVDLEDVNIDEQELTLESMETEPEALELEFDQDNQEFEKAPLEPIDLSLDIEAAPEELDLSLDEIVTAEEKQ